jgi:mannose-1-phosphate guanylyltransferase
MAGERKEVGIMFKKHSIAERDGLDLRAFVLAGGDGTRLQSLTHKIDGDGRPKQFSKIFGGKSLLTHTRDRLRPIFSDDQLPL